MEQIPLGHAVKMSDALVEIAEPVIATAQDEKQFRLAIGLAALCWNLSLLPPEERPTALEYAIRQLVRPGQPTHAMQKVMGLLIARKETLFPDDKRTILKHRVSGSRGNASIVVEYSPPDAG